MGCFESAVEPVCRCGGPRLSGMGVRRVAKAIIEIECAEVWRQISSYLDDELDPGLRAIMAAHFKDCAHCSAVLDGARNVVKLVGDGRAFEISAGASQRFYKKLKDHLRLANACGVETPERGTD